MRQRSYGLVLALILAFSLLGVVSASAEPATSGWRAGRCAQNEGLTVVVDFGATSERGWEARCRIGGAPLSDSRISALEAVGYGVGVDCGLVLRIDGLGSASCGSPPWWTYSSSEGTTGWTNDWSLDGTQSLTDWFYGVCLSDAPCSPRIPPQFGAGAPALPSPATDPQPPAAPVQPTLKVTRKPTTTRAGTVRVDVASAAGQAAATGRVKVVLKKGAAKRRAKATLTGGGAKVRLPRLAKGVWKVTVRYLGDATHPAAAATYRLRVR
ncbi:hypothetical protein KVF89_25450 [Nocardioides carbamazepini]|uniref:hypothetical protein n=1 Tax=Nocardioides carbamazepini TaxID=2854259 RepID=UPI00214A159E|nr:hypothetical protein [Nocardioides carbamazepini]MCR1785906.1 hypothetical protein [Nocardioides carbamazepini]